MQTVTIASADCQGIESARDQAVAKTRDTLIGPVVLSWCDDTTDTIALEIPCAAIPERWKEFGVANGGKLAVNVGEAADFEKPHSLFGNVVEANGNTYLCVTGACTEEDHRLISEGVGGMGGRGETSQRTLGHGARYPGEGMRAAARAEGATHQNRRRRP